MTPPCAPLGSAWAQAEVQARGRPGSRTPPRCPSADDVVSRRLEDTASEGLQAVLPAVVSVTDQSGEARYPSFKGIMAACFTYCSNSCNNTTEDALPGAVAQNSELGAPSDTSRLPCP